MDKRFDYSNSFPWIEIVDMDHNYPVRIPFREKDFARAFIPHFREEKPTILIGKDAERIYRFDRDEIIRLSYKRKDGLPSIITVDPSLLSRILGKDFRLIDNSPKGINSIKDLSYVMMNLDYPKN